MSDFAPDTGLLMHDWCDKSVDSQLVGTQSRSSVSETLASSGWSRVAAAPSTFPPAVLRCPAEIPDESTTTPSESSASTPTLTGRLRQATSEDAASPFRDLALDSIYRGHWRFPPPPGQISKGDQLLGSSSAGLLGGAIGAIAGSFIPIPGVGTTAGAIIGACIGGCVGSLLSGGSAYAYIENKNRKARQVEFPVALQPPTPLGQLTVLNQQDPDAVARELEPLLEPGKEADLLRFLVRREEAGAVWRNETGAVPGKVSDPQLAQIHEAAYQCVKGYSAEESAQLETRLRNCYYQVLDKYVEVHKKRFLKKTMGRDLAEAVDIAPALREVILAVQEAKLYRMHYDGINAGDPQIDPSTMVWGTREDLSGGKNSDGAYSAEYWNGTANSKGWGNTTTKWVNKPIRPATNEKFFGNDSNLNSEAEHIIFLSRMGEKWLAKPGALGYNPCGQAVVSRMRVQGTNSLGISVPHFAGEVAKEVYRRKPYTRPQPRDVAKYREFLAWTHAFDFVFSVADRNLGNIVLRPDGQGNLIDNGSSVGDEPTPRKGCLHLPPLSTVVLSDSMCDEIATWTPEDIDEAKAGLGLSDAAIEAAKKNLENLQRAIANSRSPDVKLRPGEERVTRIRDDEWTSTRYGQIWLDTCDRWYEAFKKYLRKQGPPGRKEDQRVKDVYRELQLVIEGYEESRSYVNPDMLSGRPLSYSDANTLAYFARRVDPIVHTAIELHMNAAVVPAWRDNLLVKSDLPVAPANAVAWELRYYAG